eukprot:6175732-Pleurochrysis_carterae.AAC.2
MGGVRNMMWVRLQATSSKRSKIDHNSPSSTEARRLTVPCASSRARTKVSPTAATKMRKLPLGLLNLVGEILDLLAQSTKQRARALSTARRKTWEFQLVTRQQARLGRRGKPSGHARRGTSLQSQKLAFAASGGQLLQGRAQRRLSVRNRPCPTRSRSQFLSSAGGAPAH